MSQEEFNKIALTNKWKIGYCHSGEECWCRLIIVEGIPDDCDFFINPSASLNKEIAEYIVNLHNNFLEVKNQNH